MRATALCGGFLISEIASNGLAGAAGKTARVGSAGRRFLIHGGRGFLDSWMGMIAENTPCAAEGARRTANIFLSAEDAEGAWPQKLGHDLKCRIRSGLGRRR